MISTPTLKNTTGTTTPAPPTRSSAAARRQRSLAERLIAPLFLAPTVIGMAIFTIVPILGSILLAFFRWDIISAPEFVGFSNFADIVSDPTVRVSFLNTIVFVVVAVTLQLGIAMALAVAIQGRMPNWLRVFFRSAFFFPLILSAASVSIFMGYLFN